MGSKKRGKKHSEKTKPRTETISLNFGKDVTIVAMHPNDDGSVTLFGPDGVLPVPAGASGWSYARGKGPKITVQVPQSGENVGTPIDVLLRAYSRVVAVDTNYDKLFGEQVAVTVACELQRSTEQVRSVPLWGFEFWSPMKDPELTGWMVAMARLRSLGWFTPNARILLCVDSHLGKLGAMNARQAPVIDGEFLPPEIQLAYASAEAGTDSVLNMVLAHCDRLARQLLARIEREPTLRDRLSLAATQPWRADRQWGFTSEGEAKVAMPAWPPT